MKVIITGSNGQLGKELTKQMDGKYELICTDRESLDILNFEKVEKFIIEKKPDVVINCAAHTAVDVCETDIDNAYKINALGPRNLAIACE